MNREDDEVAAAGSPCLYTSLERDEDEEDDGMEESSTMDEEEVGPSGYDDIPALNPAENEELTPATVYTAVQSDTLVYTDVTKEPIDAFINNPNVFSNCMIDMIPYVVHREHVRPPGSCAVCCLSDASRKALECLPNSAEAALFLRQSDVGCDISEGDINVHRMHSSDFTREQLHVIQTMTAGLMTKAYTTADQAADNTIVLIKGHRSVFPVFDNRNVKAFRSAVECFNTLVNTWIKLNTCDKK